MASFLQEYQQHNIPSLTNTRNSCTLGDVERAISTENIGLRDFLALLSPVASDSLEMVARRSKEITLSRFGRVIQLYAPLYLSNYCENNCLYCGFREENLIERKIQSPEQVEEEAKFLHEKGFRSILLVAGDDTEKCDLVYLKDVIHRIHKLFPSVSLEIGPQSKEDYVELRKAGAEGVIVYQETYNRSLYEKLHRNGKKMDFAWRLETPERVAAAGFHRVGIGALFGLNDPMEEAVSLFLHTSFLLKNHWNTRVTISLPRMRPAGGSIQPLHPVEDRTLAQIICALRIAFPEIGIVISTREEPKLRDGMIKIGATQMSAGSRTEPGGYLAPDAQKEQFLVEDQRSPSEIAEVLTSQGYEPVWKDWEASLV